MHPLIETLLSIVLFFVIMIVAVGPSLRWLEARLDRIRKKS